MDLASLLLFSMLRGRLGYLTQRQKIIAENVANADTPGYRPHDLKPFSLEAQVTAATIGAHVQAVTKQGHMSAANARTPLSGARPVRTPHSQPTTHRHPVVPGEESTECTHQ